MQLSHPVVLTQLVVTAAPPSSIAVAIAVPPA